MRIARAKGDPVVKRRAHTLVSPEVAKNGLQGSPPVMRPLVHIVNRLQYPSPYPLPQGEGA